MAGENDDKVAQPWEALGFDSFEAFLEAKDKEKDEAINAKKAELDALSARLTKQVEESQKMIQRQANELGTLRKVSGKKDEVIDDKETEVDREARIREENLKRESALTAEQQAVINEAYKKMSQEHKALVKTEEGRREFMNLVLGEGGSDEDSFVRSAPEKKLSVAEQVRAALGVVDKGEKPFASRTASGVVTTQTKEQPKEKTIPAGAARTGDLRAMLTGLKQE